MLKRIIIGLLMVAYVITGVWLGRTVMLVHMALLLLIGTHEMLDSLISGGAKLVRWVYYLYAAALLPAYLLGGDAGLVTAVLVGMLLAMSLVCLRTEPEGKQLLSAVLPVFYPALPIMAMSMLVCCGVHTGKTGKYVLTCLGIHTMIEKPVGVWPAELDALMDCIRTHPEVQSGVLYCRRANPVFAANHAKLSPKIGTTTKRPITPTAIGFMSVRSRGKENWAPKETMARGEATLAALPMAVCRKGRSCRMENTSCPSAP